MTSKAITVEEPTILVAIAMFLEGTILMDKDSLKLADKSNFTFAHFLAHHGYKFKDKDILTMANDRGITVAHAMAVKGHIFDDPSILSLTTNDGKTVRGAVMSKGLEAMSNSIQKMHRVFDDNLNDILNGRSFSKYV